MPDAGDPATFGADVLVAAATPDRLDPLRAIYDYCREHGYAPEGEAVHVGAWPVQFIPVFSPLTEEAVDRAETADFDGTPFRVVGAVYLAVIALSVGRAKDFARVLARQAAWQKSRQALSWPEKIRQAERLRASVDEIRKQRQARRRLEAALPWSNGQPAPD